MRFSSLFPFVVGAALIPQAYAWGAVGHEVVATIAQMHLHPSVMPKLCDILHYSGECHLAPVSAWADRIRSQPKYRWTGPLHYIGAVDDYPSATCAFPGPQGWEGRTHINVLSAIRNTTNVLQEFEGLRRAGVQIETDPTYVQDALKFLIHFVGDMHMPLHLTGRNRGGNGDKVAFDGRTTSAYLSSFFGTFLNMLTDHIATPLPDLHTVWDSLLISERIRTLSRNYTRPLPLPDIEFHLRDTIYDPYIRRLVWEGLLWKWQDEFDAWLACPSSTSSDQFKPHATPTFTWQYIFSLLTNKGEGEGEGKDGLGVDDDTLCPYAWAKPIHQLNCQVVFPKELDEAPFNRLSSRAFNSPASDHSHAHSDQGCGCGDVSEDAYDVLMSLTRKKSPYLELYTSDYAGLIKEQWIVEKLLTQAGIRLAAVLNWIFADLEEDEIKRALSNFVMYWRAGREIGCNTP
ncbi:phospholipase C/P1 nuclease domain-containing protein [Butyriboletus roseoflavus]|nr:phospholipase C/P1 nuclease domain-containing protein [Butyriboletus roseoflavus]